MTPSQRRRAMRRMRNAWMQTIIVACSVIALAACWWGTVGARDARAGHDWRGDA